jgi:reactive chlorine resistance protein C
MPFVYFVNYATGSPLPERFLQMVNRFFVYGASLKNTGIHLCRFGLVIVLIWIGGLKAFRYEANGIVPFVANSPVMNFFYAYEAPDYKKHMNKEGEFKPENIEWHKENNTYFFSYGLGLLIVLIGILIAVYPFAPGLSAVGSFLAFIMSLVTLSFLITTPETWVPNLGDTEYGFPYLSAAGRLVIKDVIMLGASVATMAQAAGKHLEKKRRFA